MKAKERVCRLAMCARITEGFLVAPAGAGKLIPFVLTAWARAGQAASLASAARLLARSPRRAVHLAAIACRVPPAAVETPFCAAAGHGCIIKRSMGAGRVTGPGGTGMVLLRAFLTLAALLSASPCLADPVTVLAPSHAAINGPSAAPAKVQRKKAEKAQPERAQEEVDILITLMEPESHRPQDIGMPKFLGVLYYKPDFDPSRDKPELRNLLGDAEEIRYNGKMAWGANVSVPEPGLYQFVQDGKPWWNEAKGVYLLEQAKVVLPVRGGAPGWQNSFGQSFEILPLSRPFDNTAPCLFTGRLLLDGKPLENVPVRMGCISAQKNVPGEMLAYTGPGGVFSFLLNSPGWWYCQAEIPGDPLKGPDGTMRPVERSTVFWQYAGARK